MGLVGKLGEDGAGKARQQQADAESAWRAARDESEELAAQWAHAHRVSADLVLCIWRLRRDELIQAGLVTPGAVYLPAPASPPDLGQPTILVPAASLGPEVRAEVCAVVSVVAGLAESVEHGRFTSPEQAAPIEAGARLSRLMVRFSVPLEE